MDDVCADDFKWWVRTQDVLDALGVETYGIFALPGSRHCIVRLYRNGGHEMAASPRRGVLVPLSPGGPPHLLLERRYDLAAPELHRSDPRRVRYAVRAHWRRRNRVA